LASFVAKRVAVHDDAALWWAGSIGADAGFEKTKPAGVASDENAKRTQMDAV